VTPRRVALWSLVPLLALLAAYARDVGHGFLKDDFGWIAGSRCDGPLGWLELFTRHNGFYRPLVSASFALDERLFGMNAMAYGLTNLGLVVIAMAGIAWLAERLGLGWGFGLVAAGLWGLNPHGIGFSVLWISGRTSLLVTVFALLAAVAAVSGRMVLAAVALLGALLSKEEAALLPFVLAVWAGLSPELRARFDRRRAAWTCGILLLPLVAYLVLRMRTTAYLPWSAPTFYRATLDPSHVLRNVLEYVDRACTAGAIAVLVSALILWRWPRLDARERYWLALGAVWLVGGYGPTVLLPVRSSLYALLPSVGAVLAAAALLHALWRVATPGRRRALLVAGVVVPFALLPVYRSRNVRLARDARFSSQALQEIAGAREALAAGRMLVLYDNAPGGKVGLQSSFGTLVQEAVRVTTGIPTARVWVEPPPADWRAAGLAPPGNEETVAFRVRDGRLLRE
jgi:hypothetical protein